MLQLRSPVRLMFIHTRQDRKYRMCGISIQVQEHEHEHKQLARQLSCWMTDHDHPLYLSETNGSLCDPYVTIGGRRPLITGTISICVHRYLLLLQRMADSTNIRSEGFPFSLPLSFLFGVTRTECSRKKQ